MASSAEKLEQAELGLAKAQEALDQVGKVLEAAEKAQAAADHARVAADHAHETLRKINRVLPIAAVVLAAVVLATRWRRSP